MQRQSPLNDLIRNIRLAIVRNSLANSSSQVHDEDPEPYASLPDGFRYQGYVGLGSELAVVNDIGSFAQEGAALLVVDVRLGVGSDGETQEEYLCESAHGDTLWLEPEQMDDWVVFTGKTRQGF